MLLNISSVSSNSSLQPAVFTLSYSTFVQCVITKPSSQVFATFHITNILLLLPLCILILHHGLRQRHQKRSTSSTAIMSHSDCFTYHLVTIQLIGTFGGVLFCCGIFSHYVPMMTVGGLAFSFNWYGQILFNILTCVERYLAVIHPITYRSLRNKRWVRIRNINILWIWLLSGLGVALVLRDNTFVVMDISILITSLVVIFFCSLSVLRVLIHPGPGEQGGVRERVDQIKRRAFYTIVAILGVLFMRFAYNLFWIVGFMYQQESTCLVMVGCTWINLPNSLMLPLLFLRRKGKLMCFKNNIQR